MEKAEGERKQERKQERDEVAWLQAQGVRVKAWLAKSVRLGRIP